MSRVICVDNSSRPADIPLSKWPKLKTPYTVINAFKDMNDVLLYQLEEIEIVSLGTSYKGYAASRFKVAEDGGGVELVEELELQLVG